MDYAVTGASGFIGSHVCKRLLEQGHRVTALGNTAPPKGSWRRKIWDQTHKQVTIDLTATDPNFNGIDRVIHLAADMGGVGFFTANDYWPYIKNSRMTFRVLGAIGFWETPRSFVAASACAYPTESQMWEGHPVRLAEWMLERGTPDQMYGREKLMLTRLAERHPQDVRVGLLHTVYGIGQEHQGERVKFPMAAAVKAIQARETGVVEMWGNGQQMRSYLYIDDAVRKILTMLNNVAYDGPTNIGFDGATTCLQIQQLCNRLAGVPDATIVLNSAKPSGVLARDCSNDKWRTLYGNEILIGYDEGYRRIVDWLDEIGPY